MEALLRQLNQLKGVIAIVGLAITVVVTNRVGIAELRKDIEGLYGTLSSLAAAISTATQDRFTGGDHKEWVSLEYSPLEKIVYELELRAARNDARRDERERLRVPSQD